LRRAAGRRKRRVRKAKTGGLRGKRKKEVEVGVVSVCYRLRGKLWHVSHGYYMLYLHVRDAPVEVRKALEMLVGREVDVAILCP